MPAGHKITTCCYCGIRAVLVLDKRRHELSCGACGAPLREMKAMPAPVLPRQKVAEVPADVLRHRPVQRPVRKDRKSHEKPCRKGRRRFGGRVLEELWDTVEDFFD